MRGVREAAPKSLSAPRGDGAAGGSPIRLRGGGEVTPLTPQRGPGGMTPPVRALTAGPRAAGSIPTASGTGRAGAGGEGQSCLHAPRGRLSERAAEHRLARAPEQSGQAPTGPWQVGVLRGRAGHGLRSSDCCSQLDRRQSAMRAWGKQVAGTLDSLAEGLVPCLCNVSMVLGICWSLSCYLCLVRGAHQVSEVQGTGVVPQGHRQ